MQGLMLFQANFPRYLTRIALLRFKGTSSCDFLLQVFSCIIFTQAPENNIRVILNFFENCGDIRKSRCTTGINDTSGKFATGINDTGGKFVTGGKFANETSGKQ